MDGRSTCFALGVLGVALCLVTVPVAADWETAVAAYNRGDYTTAETEFAIVVQDNPDYGGAHYMLGVCRLQLGRVEEAAASLRRAVELKSDKIQYRLALGRALVAAKSYEEASTVLAGVDLAALPEEQRTGVVLLRAKAALAAGRPVEVVGDLQERLQADDTSADLHRALALALSATGDRAAAFVEMERTFELDESDLISARSAVEIALGLAGQATDPDESVRWNENARRVAKKLATAAPTCKHFTLVGEAAHGAGDLDAAVHWFRKARQEEPGNARLGFYLGRTLGEVGRDDEALDVLGAALTAGADVDLERRIHRHVARISERNLDLDAAAEHYRLAGEDDRSQRVLEIKGRFGEALAMRSEIRGKIGELRTLERSLEELGDSQGVAAVRTQVASLQSDLNALETNLANARRALRAQ